MWIVKKANKIIFFSESTWKQTPDFTLRLEDIKHSEKRQDFLLWLQIGTRNIKWEDNYASPTHTFFLSTFRKKCALHRIQATASYNMHFIPGCHSGMASQYENHHGLYQQHTFSFSTVKHDESKTSAVQENMKESANKANKL